MEPSRAVSEDSGVTSLILQFRGHIAVNRRPRGPADVADAGGAMVVRLLRTTSRREPAGWHIVRKPGRTRPEDGLRSSPSDLSNATTKPLVSSTLLLPGQEEPITQGWEITRELGHTVEAVIDFSQPEPEIVRRGVGGRV
jgi:hypothetical protein